jgi:tRNA 2-selenouridine synthase
VRFNVLTGLAGTGKTAMLEQLRAAGEQVVDLEGLAAHRGSSYGRIGITALQPTQPEFDGLVRSALAACDPGRPVWLEDEGPHIGSLWLPAEVAVAITNADTAELSRPLEERVQRLVATYGSADPQELINATQRIRRRLGNPRADRAISHFHAGRPDTAIRVLLEYFDHGYALRAAHTTRCRLMQPLIESLDRNLPETEAPPPFQTAEAVLRALPRRKARQHTASDPPTVS